MADEVKKNIFEAAVGKISGSRSRRHSRSEGSEIDPLGHDAHTMGPCGKKEHHPQPPSHMHIIILSLNCARSTALSMRRVDVAGSFFALRITVPLNKSRLGSDVFHALDPTLMPRYGDEWHAIKTTPLI